MEYNLSCNERIDTIEKANLSKGRDAKPRVLSESYDSRLPNVLEEVI